MQPGRPWVGLQTPTDDQDRALFSKATKVQIGNGSRTSFWKDNWIGGAPLCTIFPTLFHHARRKNRTVGAALHNEQWILDLQHGDTMAIATEYLRLWRLINDAHTILNSAEEDRICWTDTRDGRYTAKSAYRIQCQQAPNPSFNALIWKVWAPNKLKMFMWIFLQNRLWCNDRLQRRGWPNRYFCPLCLRNLETSTHLIWSCNFPKEIWRQSARWTGCSSLAPRDRRQLNSI